MVPWASLLMPSGLLEPLPRAEEISASSSCLLLCSSYSSFDFLAENESDLLCFLGQSSNIAGGFDDSVALKLAHGDHLGRSFNLIDVIA